MTTQGYPQMPPAGWQPQAAGPPPRRRRRIFLWFFLAVQALFIIWLVVGLSSGGTGPTVAAQTAHACAGAGWEGLFRSHADCMRHYAAGLHDASDVGKGIGAVVIFGAWFFADVALGIGYGIYRLAMRP